MKKIHIGAIVEDAFNQRENKNLNKSQFAEAIGIKNQNLNRELKNEDWSVIKLIKAGKILNHSFAHLFELDGLKKIEPPKILLQIEVQEDNMKEVANLITNNELYQIVKNETE